MKKKNRASAFTQRQIELTKRYYDVDDERRVITLKLHYEKASEVLSEDIFDTKNPVFNEGVIEHVREVIDTFPYGYSIDLKLVINDYEGYDAKTLLQSFNDRFEFNNYGADNDFKKGWFKALILTIVGLVFMLFNLHAKKADWYGTGTEVAAFDLVFDSFATLLIWQAGTVIFLSRSEYKESGVKLLAKINSISFLNGRDLSEKASEDETNIRNNWVQLNKPFKAGRFLLVTCDFLLAVQCLSYISQLIETFTDTSFSWSSLNAFVIFVRIVGIVWYALTVIAGFEYYLEKGKLRYAVPFFAATTFLISIAAIVISFYVSSQSSSSVSMLSTAVHYFVSLFADIGYGIGYLMCAIIRKKNNKKFKQRVQK